ncbi:MAG: hypothetical protein IT385_22500 [Deltaproteobacteria bacterium]|nr:hypothetical protein [Deltaproteobacteria bacterium]
MSAALVITLASALALGGARRPYGGAIDVVVPDAGAALDPHLALDRPGRLLASLVHGRLFRPVVVGDRLDVVPELAAGPGAASEGALTITLHEGARCHDGQLLTPADVVATWARLAQVGPLRAMAAGVRVAEAGPRAVTFTFPRGLSADELMMLLARPEAAMLRGGRAASTAGCGAFRPTSVAPDASGRLALEAFAGHAEGRPWIDRIRVRVDARVELATAFRYGESDVAWEPVVGASPSATVLPGGWTSFLVVPRPALRAPAQRDLRRRIAQLAGDARLQRYVEGRGASAVTPWPDALAPMPTSPLPPAPSAAAVSGLVIAYPDGDAELAELARALRDALRSVSNDNARVVGVARLSLSSAAAEREPLWDLAVVRHGWASLTREQAAFELADALGQAFGSVGAGADALAGGARRWAEGIAARLDVIGLVHVPRGTLVAAGLRGVGAAAATPGLVDAYRPASRAPAPSGGPP